MKKFCVAALAIAYTEGGPCSGYPGTFNTSPQAGLWGIMSQTAPSSVKEQAKIVWTQYMSEGIGNINGCMNSRYKSNLSIPDICQPDSSTHRFCGYTPNGTKGVWNSLSRNNSEYANNIENTTKGCINWADIIEACKS